MQETKNTSFKGMGVIGIGTVIETTTEEDVVPLLPGQYFFFFIFDSFPYRLLFSHRISVPDNLTFEFLIFPHFFPLSLYPALASHFSHFAQFFIYRKRRRSLSPSRSPKRSRSRSPSPKRRRQNDSSPSSSSSRSPSRSP
jgi:hypothetical protein